MRNDNYLIIDIGLCLLPFAQEDPQG